MLAKNMALKSVSRFRLGAVLARRGKVLSTGYNQMRKTHPLMRKHSNEEFELGLHAEVHACIGVSAGDLHGADVWVARVCRDGKLAIAKPCSVCQRFLRSVGVNRVYYSMDDGHYGVMKIWK